MVILWAFFCVHDVVFGFHRMDTIIKPSSSDLNPGAVTDGRCVGEIKAYRGSGVVISPGRTAVPSRPSHSNVPPFLPVRWETPGFFVMNPESQAFKGCKILEHGLSGLRGGHPLGDWVDPGRSPCGMTNIGWTGREGIVNGAMQTLDAVRSGSPRRGCHFVHPQTRCERSGLQTSGKQQRNLHIRERSDFGI